MIMGSFVPCIYYGFYCQFYEKLIYSVCVTVLGIASIIVALWDKFATPAFRPIRAGKVHKRMNILKYFIEETSVEIKNKQINK